MKPGGTTDEPFSQRRRLANATLLAGFLSLVAITYAFVVSAGHFTAWPRWTDYYDTQAEGFRAGHLYTTVPPTPGLERLDDPLNPANARFWRWDYSYFGGHLYLYWGLAPAVLLAAVKALLHTRGVVGDEVLVFAFLVGRALVGCLLIRAMARRLTVPPPAWAVWVAMAAFALAHPTPYLLARAAIYEAAIAAGALFLLGGLALAFQAIFASTRRAADGWLLGASLSLGLAGASRVSLFPAALGVVGCAIWARWRSDGGGFRRLSRIALAAAGPAGAVALAHLATNQLRFGSWTEFGTSHQMSMPGFKIGLRFLVANLHLYLLLPLSHSCEFPFLFANWKQSRALSPDWLPFAADHRLAEPTAGLLVTVPFLWLGLGALASAALRGWRAHGPGDGRTSEPAEVASRWRWVSRVLCISTLACAAPLLVMFNVSMRYEADFASGLLLIAILSGWCLLSAPASRAGRGAARTIYAVLAAASVASGILLGFGGYDDQFDRHNPALMSHLRDALSICGAR